MPSNRIEGAPEFHTMEETIRILRCGRTTGYDLVRRGDLKAVRVGRRLLIPRSEIEELKTRAAAGGK